MKVSVFSNYFNAHQLPLAMAFIGAEDVEFTFISLESMEVEGRDSLDFEHDFVLREYESESAAAEALEHAQEDDLVVFGDMSGKERYVKARAKTGRHFFRYSERSLKRGDWMRWLLPKRRRMHDWFLRYRNSDMYLLCAGAYACRDLSLFGFPVEKCLKWGYFPQIETRIDRSSIASQGLKICSVQRLVDWKRVDLQLRLASRLKAVGCSFTLTIVGDGPEREALESMSHKFELDREVCFAGSLSRREAQAVMVQSDVFLATSNRKEGWGATVNEAMAAGCCVIGCEEMGSVPYLIEDGANGLMFSDEDGLYSKVKQCFENPEVAVRLGRAAQQTIAGEWSAEEAARRLIAFERAWSSGQIISYDDGPLSPA